MKATCPKHPRHNRFIVSAHVVQEWVVQGDGSFIRCTKECTDVTHRPDEDDIWVCAECYTEADVTT